MLRCESYDLVLCTSVQLVPHDASQKLSSESLSSSAESTGLSLTFQKAVGPAGP